MKSMKLRGVFAAVSGALMLGAFTTAMADSNDDLIYNLMANGALDEEQGHQLLDSLDKDHAAGKQAAASKTNGSGIDFLNDDAPFKTNLKLGSHDADIQFYGVIDVAGAHQNHSLPKNNYLPNNLYPYQGAPIKPQVSSQNAWINGGLQDSRIGLKGGIDLFSTTDNKYRFIYQFEAGFNPLAGGFGRINDAAKSLAQNSGTGANSSVNADSSLNGDFFARQAWVGIDGGKLGKVSYGIQYNPFYDITASYDPTGKADTFSPFGESGTIGGGGGISEDSRMKNSLKYANSFNAPMDGKINIAGMYEFGNASGDTSHGYGATGQVGYENSLFGVQFAYDRFEDALKAGNGSVVNTISAKLYNTDATMLALKWTPTKDLKFYGGWEWYQLKAPSDSTIHYGTLFNEPVNNPGYATAGLNPGYKQNNNIYYVGASFDFAERIPVLAGLTTSLGYYATRFDAIKGPTISTNSEGKIDTWTFIADYKLNKRFDTYFAYTNNHFSGDKFPSASNYTNVDLAGVGVRMRF